MRRIKASDLDPRREELLFPFLLLLLVPILLIRGIITAVQFITSPFIKWDE